jgi:hypothetical protein
LNLRSLPYPLFPFDVPFLVAVNIPEGDLVTNTGKNPAKDSNGNDSE